MEKPQRSSLHTLTLTGYDRVTRLDQDLSQWLESLEGWPYTLDALAAMVCDACGLELETEGLPGGDHPVEKFSAAAITGRQLMRWIGEACGCFCRATPGGKLEFAWYTPADRSLTPGGEACYFQNSLTYADYTVCPVEKVQLRQTQEDVGTVWPNETGGKNTYRITGNLLLTADTADALLPVAQGLFERLQAVSYTPCRVRIPADPHIRAGHILTVTDRRGKTLTAYVMTSAVTGNQQTLECTGSSSRDSATAVNRQSYQALSGKLLELRTDVDGVVSQNRDTLGRLSLLQQTVEGMTARVEDQQGQITRAEQTAQAVTLRVGQLEQNGVDRVSGTGYSFSQEGLLIEKDRHSVKTRIDNEGMEVSANAQPVLTADHRGVVAVDVTAQNYLQIGHARFESYTTETDRQRTACFWI